MVATTGERIYVLGGFTADGATDSTFAYDPTTDEWMPRSPAPTARGAGAAAVIAGQIYVVGGQGKAGTVADLAMYDPAADAWTMLPPMPTARNHVGAAAIGERMFVVGGHDGAGQIYAALEVYDPAAGSWRVARAMPTSRSDMAVAALGGRLFVMGGQERGGPNDGFDSPTRRTRAYDPARDVWIAMPDMGIPRHSVPAVAIDGAILVSGGQGEDENATNAVEAFVSPDGEVLTVRRLRQRGSRVALRALLGGAADIDPTRVELRIDADEALAVALPAGALTRNRARRRWRLVRPKPAGLAGLEMRARRDGTLVVDLRAAAAGTARPQTLEVTLGERRFCGPVPP
jgi:N-acetylneuraminic acid mutarotase